MKRKTIKKQDPNDKPKAARTQAVLEEITRRAYELWESGGCQHGQDQSHWLRAEKEVRKSAGIN